MIKIRFIVCGAFALVGSALAASQSYENVVRGYREKLAAIDAALLKIPLNKGDLIKESHAQLLKSYRAIRAELDTLAQKLNAATAAAPVVQSMIDDLLEGIAEPVEKKSTGVERLLAVRSRLVAEADAIRRVQDRIFKQLGKMLAFNKKILITLSDTIGNGMITIINTIINEQIDPLINKRGR